MKKNTLESISFDGSCLRMFSGNNSAITWGFKRYQLCLQGTSHSAKQHQQAAMGHWVSLLE
jgi:hypothetical protein